MVELIWSELVFFGIFDLVTSDGIVACVESKCKLSSKTFNEPNNGGGFNKQGDDDVGHCNKCVYILHEC